MFLICHLLYHIETGSLALRRHVEAHAEDQEAPEEAAEEEAGGQQQEQRDGRAAAAAGGRRGQVHEPLAHAHREGAGAG